MAAFDVRGDPARTRVVRRAVIGAAMNDNAPPKTMYWPAYVIYRARSLQRLRDWRYCVDFLFEACPGLAYAVTKVDYATEHGNIHSAEMWGGYRDRG